MDRFEGIAVGDIVQVAFLDHTQNGEEPMSASVTGMLINMRQDSVVIDTWHTGMVDRRPGDTCECYCIVKSCVTLARKMVPWAVNGSLEGAQ